jgi:hypothetical protein
MLNCLLNVLQNVITSLDGMLGGTYGTPPGGGTELTCFEKEILVGTLVGRACKQYLCKLSNERYNRVHATTF